MKKRIALVPLDNRPCCLQFPKRIGQIGDWDILTPPDHLLGEYTTPGDCEKVKEWLLEVAGQVDGLVIALDQLAYGGLVASRTPERNLKQCLETIQIIPSLKKKFPHLQIYVANVLMRISITSKNEEYLRYWKLIFDYSQLYDRVYRLHENSRKEELEQLEKQIPKEILQDYFKARERNHEVNKKMIDWAAEGFIDYLVITQEDASAVGIHLSEQRNLMEQIFNRRVQSKVLVYPGADEATQTLLVRMIQHFEQRRLKIYPRYTSTAGRLSVAKFEDRPVEESVKAHLQAAGAICVDQPNDADMILFVNTPLADYELDGNHPVEKKAYFNSRHSLWDIIEGIRYYLKQQKEVAIADISFPNASDMELIQFLLEENIYSELTSYAGWNTAGNSLGTAISHAIARTLYNKRTEERETVEQAHYSFLVERLMDEWAYQAQVRGEINQWIQSELLVNPNDLETEYDKVNKKVQDHLMPFFQELKKSMVHVRDENIDRENKSKKFILQDVQISDIFLPWNRTFEVFISATCSIKKLDEWMI
jgi:hypothetical protein